VCVPTDGALLHIYIVTKAILLVIFIFLGDPLSEKEVMMLIRKADKDGDGWIDFQEFLKVMIG
jgi:Ca2+-binding EF-hand superfamily protein